MEDRNEGERSRTGVLFGKSSSQLIMELSATLARQQLI